MFYKVWIWNILMNYRYIVYVYESFGKIMCDYLVYLYVNKGFLLVCME